LGHERHARPGDYLFAGRMNHLGRLMVPLQNEAKAFFQRSFG
jgi:hypothetical protein